MKLKAMVKNVLFVFCAVNVYGEDPPLVVPNTIGPDGKDIPTITFTTKAYKNEAFRLVLEEANKVARELQLPEKLPITQTDIVEAYVSPFGMAWTDKSIGNVTTKKYTYFVSQGNKFSYLVEEHLEDDLYGFQKKFTWPVSRIDTNAVYQLATQFLTAVSMDIAGLNRDHSVVIKPDDIYYGNHHEKFVPVYDIYWPNGSDAGGSAASIQIFLPAKKLLQLHVEDPKYILRKPLVFTNLAYLLSQTNSQAATNAPGAP